jgi:hypothetical protein
MSRHDDETRPVKLRPEVAFEVTCDGCGKRFEGTLEDKEDWDPRVKPKGDRWTQLSGGRFTRNYLACSAECEVKVAEEKTPPEMKKEGHALGDYVAFFWPAMGRVPREIERHARAPRINNPRVYIAGPLRGMGESIGPNVHQAVKVGMELAYNGYVPFIPHLFALAQCIVPAPEDAWMALNREWLSICGAVVRLEGPSVGSDREVFWAEEFGIPVWVGVEAFLKDGPVPLIARAPRDPEIRP